MSTFKISYKEPGYETSEVPPGQTLAEELDAANSPFSSDAEQEFAVLASSKR